MCSESKKKCIYAVSKQLGMDVDWKALGQLSDQQASERIDQLKAQLDKNDTASGDRGENQRFNQWRFGMVVKIVFDKFPSGYLIANPDIFTEQVSRIYDLVAKAEGQLKGQSKMSSETGEVM